MCVLWAVEKQGLAFGVRLTSKNMQVNLHYMATGTTAWRTGKSILRNVNDSRVALKHLLEARKQMLYNDSCFGFIVEDNSSVWLLTGCDTELYGCMNWV